MTKNQLPAEGGLLEEQTKSRILKFLPDAIGQALKSYHGFMLQDSPGEAKEFSAHHNACKVAIAHIELLIKLARWVDANADDLEDQNSKVILEAMMNEAQAELKKYETFKDKNRKDQSNKEDPENTDH